MKFSALAPFGLLRFGGTRSLAEQFLTSYLDAMHESAADDPLQRGVAFATSISQALSARTIERAGNQAKPSKAGELIALLEEDYGVRAGPNDGLAARRGRLVAAAKLWLGNSPGNVRAALSSLLGSDFVDLRAVWPEEVELSSDPTNHRDVRVLPRDVQLTEDVAKSGAAVFVGYENLGGASGPYTGAPESVLAKGDVVMVDGENTGTREVVTVLDVAGEAGARSFSAVFTKPHGVGTTVTTADWPAQWSTKRFVYVVVKAEAAANQETRDRIDALMGKLVRGATQWAIVSPTSPGANTIGPFQLGVTPLGTAPLASIDRFTSSPPATQGPAIEYVDENNGSEIGGQVRYVRGLRLTGATSVVFGVDAATIQSVADDVIEVLTPTVAPATVDVTVTTPAGTTTKVGAFTFT